MIHRREFLKSSIGAAATASLPSRVFAEDAEKPIRAALIGCVWYGKTDLLHLIQVAPVEVVGLCDVDRRMCAEAADLVAQRQPSGKRPPTFGDYRKLLAEERPEVVLVGTPDHWHCLATIDACKSGADVYVQKPVSYDVVEGQAMVAAARKYKRTVQVGLQRRSTPHLLEARERFVRSGQLGRIGHAEIHSYYGTTQQFPANTAPPDYLDWEMYVGPAAWRDYNPAIHPRAWRDCREFSNGQAGDLCVHFFDFVRYCLGLGWPRRISAAGGNLMRPQNSNINTPDTQIAFFDYGDLQVVWNQRNWGPNSDQEYPWGATLYGEKGTLRLSVQKYDYTPLEQGVAVHGDYVEERGNYPEDQQYKEIDLPAAPGTRRHLQDFLAARRSGERPVADIEEGHISTACCILANLSMELGRSIAWDAAAGQIAGDQEANERLARKYRDPWVHPTPDLV